MIKFEKEMESVIIALEKSGILSQCIISGGWAMFFYKQIFDNFEPPIATTDFDIFLPNVTRLKGSDISKALYDIDYLREDDFLTGKTRYFSKNGFEIEFLTLLNKTMNNVIKVKSLNISAEALPKLQILLWNYITVRHFGCKINIPSPVSFCLQKLLINQERKPDKQEKDIFSIKYLLDFINPSNKYRDEFIETFGQCPRKWKKQILNTIKIYDLRTPLNFNPINF